MIFIDKMKNLKIYKKPMYLPTIEGDKKKGSAVLLLTPEYLSSRRLIQSDLLVNKLRFQSYYLNPNVSYYINGQVAKGKQMSEYISEMDVIQMYHSLAEMATEERNKIPDSKFGLPSKRKYPLDTADHVRSAIRFFNYVDKEDEEELAHNIINRMGNFFDDGEMPKIGKNNRLFHYVNERSETILQHIGNTSQNPELVKKGKEKNSSDKTKLKQGGFQAKKEEKKQREEQVKTEALLNIKTPKSVKLYHGSTVQGLKYIDPNHDTFNFEVGNVDRVYTSDDPAFSACFAVRWNDDIAKQGSWDDWNTVTFGISDKVDLNKPCSMYEVENDGTFTQIKMKEFICDHRVKVIKETRFKTGRDMLNHYRVEVISLDEYQKRLHGNYHIEAAVGEGTLEDPTMNPAIEETFGWLNPKDNRWNAIVRLAGDNKNLYRGRSTMVVLSQDRKEIFLAKNDNDDDVYPYRMPGGGWDENEDHMFTAIREAREEARMEVTDVKFMNCYCYVDEIADWVKNNVPKEIWWAGYYTEVFVGIHNGSYMGKVEKQDQDNRMIKTGKFYPINQVIDKLNPAQQQAVKKYLNEYNKQFKSGIKATHILASGIIRDKAGRMLLEWHNKANGLVLPSGKANPNEDPYKTLVRELHEELGIIVTDATLNERSSYQAEYPVGSGNWVIFDEYNYIVNSYTGIIENREPEKHKELTWLSESELLDEGMNLTDELYNYLDYFLHGFTGTTDDTLYDAIAQFIWFSGTTTDVEWAKRVFTPEFYYKFLDEIVPFPIYTTRDIPIINIKINPYYAGLDCNYITYSLL